MRTLLLLLLAACGGGEAEPPAAAASSTPPVATVLADVTAVAATGEAGAYTFGATVRSPDLSCEQYADWWEVVSPEGALIYRRVLNHSHPDEQPFTRTGGPVPVGATDTVVVRAHLHPGGYGGQALRGSVATGFTVASDVDAAWASGLATSAPLPEECWY